MTSQHNPLPETERDRRRRILKPVYREIVADLETPITTYLKVAESPSFLLESVEQGERIARYSFIGSGQRMRFEARGNDIRLIHAAKEGADDEVQQFHSDDPLRTLWDVVVQPCYDDPNLPLFWSGAVGYTSYDMARLYDPVPANNSEAYDVPDSLFVQPEALIVFDHRKRNVVIVAAAIDNDAEDIARAERAIDALQQKIRKMQSVLPTNPSDQPMEWHYDTEEHAHKKALQQALQHIHEGDALQLVLSRRAQATCTIHPFAFYRALRAMNPSPYLGYIDLGTVTLVSSSPESMLSSKDGHSVQTLAIAGTRERGDSAQQDEQRVAELLNDEAARAKHIMMVDVSRNDLGRVCEYGTVHVPDLMRVERFSHIMHVVSTIAGTLKGDKTPLDALAATLPMAAMSGTPKLVAMVLIDALESTRRGLYGGAFGYISVNGAIDMAPTTRAAVVVDDQMHLQAGESVLADAHPDIIYQKTMDKLHKLMKVADVARKGLE